MEANNSDGCSPHYLHDGGTTEGFFDTGRVDILTYQVGWSLFIKKNLGNILFHTFLLLFVTIISQLIKTVFRWLAIAIGSRLHLMVEQNAQRFLSF